MRAPLLLGILLLLPSASAASQVHVTLVEDGYAITFVSNATSDTVPVSLLNTSVQARRVDEEGGDVDRVYRASVPFGFPRYAIEGRTFDLVQPPTENATVRVVFVADMGTDANASRVVDAIVREKPSLVVIGGDLSYANGAAGPWNDWFDLIEPLAARVPVMPAYGNHEDYCDEDGRFVACGPGPNEWHAHFALPNGEELYYAFDWGPLRFTVLDTEAFVHAEGEHTSGRDEQAAFLRASLDEDEARWDVVAFHRPLRSTIDRDGATGGDEAIEALEPALDDADLVLAAHVHAYERSWPLRQGEPVARSSDVTEGNGTFHVTSGGGGRSLYDTWRAAEPWLATRAAEHHYMVLEATPTHLDVRAVRLDGTILDEMSVTRPTPPTPPSPPSPPRATTPTIEGNATVEPPVENATPAPGVLLALVAVGLAARRRFRV